VLTNEKILEIIEKNGGCCHDYDLRIIRKIIEASNKEPLEKLRESLDTLSKAALRTGAVTITTNVIRQLRVIELTF
jgi:putative N-acetylmannosamine-6-phosphate epimerase